MRELERSGDGIPSGATAARRPLRPHDHPTAAERREDKTASPKAMVAPKGRGLEVRVSCWHAADRFRQSTGLRATR
jgi:hypothetical protein